MTLLRVPAFLKEKRVGYETNINPPAFTAQKRAKALRIPGKQLAKSVLLSSSNGFMLAVLPATHHVDLDYLARHFDRPFTLASDEDVAETFRDCEWGVLMPFGTLYGIPTLLDDSFDPQEDIVFEAHFHACTIRMRCRDYEKLENPRRLPLALGKR